MCECDRGAGRPPRLARPAPPPPTARPAGGLSPVAALVLLTFVFLPVFSLLCGVFPFRPAPVRSASAPPALVADGGRDTPTDNTPRLQALVDAAPAGGTVTLPAGVFGFLGSVYVDKDGVRVTGAGRGATTLLARGGGGRPPLVLGMRRAEKGGGVDATFRPSCAGVLDASVPPGATGFDTKGVALGVALGHPASLGRNDPGLPGGPWYDYWGTCRGLTVQVCFDPGPAGLPRDAPLLGVGRLTGDPDPSPWGVSEGGTGSGTSYLFQWRSTDSDGDAPAFPRTSRQARFDLAGFARPYRLRVVLDLDAGTLAVRCHGKPVAVEWLTDGPGAGLRFSPNLKGRPFCVAAQGDAFDPNGTRPPSVRFYGLKIDGAPLPSEPPDDAGRYLSPGPDTVAFLSLLGGSERTLEFPAGPAWTRGGPGGGSLWLIRGDGSFGGNTGQAVTDLTLGGGSPSLLFWSSLDARVERCDLDAGPLGASGAACLPGWPSYTVAFRDCRFNGRDAGLDWRWGSVVVDRCVVNQGGTTSLRFTACNWVVRDTRVSYFAPHARSGLHAVAGWYGRLGRVETLDLDNESSDFGRAAVLLEAGYAGGTAVRLDGVSFARLGAKAAAVELVGTRAGGAPGSVHASRLLGPTDPAGFGYALRVRGRDASMKGDAWTGSVDTGWFPTAKKGAVDARVGVDDSSRLILSQPAASPPAS